MKYSFVVAIIALVTLPCFASAKETVQILSDLHGNECENQAGQIIENIKKLSEQIPIDGRYTVTSRDSDLCITTATLQDSSFEFTTSTEHTKSSAKRGRTLERLDELLQKVQARTGYLWHVVESDDYAFFKSRMVDTLYIIHKP